MKSVDQSFLDTILSCVFLVVEVRDVRDKKDTTRVKIERQADDSRAKRAEIVSFHLRKTIKRIKGIFRTITMMVDDKVSTELLSVPTSPLLW